MPAVVPFLCLSCFVSGISIVFATEGPTASVSIGTAPPEALVSGIGCPTGVGTRDTGVAV